jgi:hypothetical protein
MIRRSSELLAVRGGTSFRRATPTQFAIEKWVQILIKTIVKKAIYTQTRIGVKRLNKS